MTAVLDKQGGEEGEKRELEKVRTLSASTHWHSLCDLTVGPSIQHRPFFNTDSSVRQTISQWGSEE